MKQCLRWSVVFAISLVATPLHAQSWKPEKNIEILIGLTAGSSQDRTGRSLQKVWQETKVLNAAVGVPVNVVNRPGGGGQVALTVLAQHTGDPHFLHIVFGVLLPKIIATH